jgi:hypothetical protein
MENVLRASQRATAKAGDPVASEREWSHTLSIKRFVVGSLDNPQHAGDVVQDLLRHDLPLASISILAKQPLLAANALFGELPITEIAETNLIATNRTKIVCLGNGLGDILRMRAGEDGGTLKRIFQRCLLPRHARNLSEIVEEGGILIWVETLSPEDEKTASLSLLRNSTGTVQVHDFAIN